MNHMKNIIIVVLLISETVGSFFFGANLSKRGLAKSVEGMQAKLHFAHLQVYSNLQSDFLLDCRSRLKSRLERVIDEQKMQMAEYVQNNSDVSFEEYINFRDGDLIEELRSYKINWDKKWILPACKKY